MGPPPLIGSPRACSPNLLCATATRQVNETVRKWERKKEEDEEEEGSLTSSRLPLASGANSSGSR